MNLVMPMADWCLVIIALAFCSSIRGLVKIKVSHSNSDRILPLIAEELDEQIKGCKSRKALIEGNHLDENSYRAGYLEGQMDAYKFLKVKLER